MLSRWRRRRTEGGARVLGALLGIETPGDTAENCWP
jgi:hypothetical protein